MTDIKILETAKQAIIASNMDNAIEIAKQAVSDGYDVSELINTGFIPGIQEVGDLFGRGKLFLPELIKAGDAMSAVMDILSKSMPDSQKTQKGVFVIATVKGDVHDIGKGIVVSLLRANGITVHDLGRDVKTETIIEEAVRVNADIIGTSALLTTTMPKQKELEEALRKDGLREKFKTIIGGAPVTPRWADRIGADVYAADAQDAVTKTNELLKR